MLFDILYVLVYVPKVDNSTEWEGDFLKELYDMVFFITESMYRHHDSLIA